MGGSTPTPQAAVTPKSQLTPQELEAMALANKATKMNLETQELLHPAYQDLARYQVAEGDRRLATAKDFEIQGAKLLPKANVLSPEFQEQLGKDIALRKATAQQTLSDIYDPISDKTTAGLYSRLGGLKSSIAGDVLGQLEGERADSARQLTTGIEMDRQNIESNQLAKQLQALDTLTKGASYYGGLAQDPTYTLQASLGQGAGIGRDISSSLVNQGIGLSTAVNAANQQDYQNKIQAYSTPSKAMQWAQVGANMAAAFVPGT